MSYGETSTSVVVPAAKPRCLLFLLRLHLPPQKRPTRASATAVAHAPSRSL